MATNYKSSLGRYQRYLESVKSRPLWRATLYLALSLMLLIVLLVTALRPTLVTITKLLSDIEKEKELNSRMESKIGQIAEAQSLLADSKVSSRLGLLDQGLPADPKFGPLGDMLAAIVSESGLEIRTLNVGELQVEPKPETGGENNISGRVNFDLSARGNYAGIRKLVERLEEWRRVVEFKKVQITSASTGGGGELEVNISAAVGYVYEKK